MLKEHPARKEPGRLAGLFLFSGLSLRDVVEASYVRRRNNRRPEPKHSFCLVQGAAGTGRTTLGLQFLVDGLDALVGGGLQRGTSCVLLVAAGTGKTTLACLYAHAVAEQGERAAIFAFDERPETMMQRAEGIGLHLRRHVAKAGSASSRSTRASLHPASSCSASARPSKTTAPPSW